MTFLNPWMLLAWTVVAVPIVIHLLNRRSAKKVEWGAMHFLLGSLVSRKRRILLEETLLLASRCLLVALTVTALARPVIPAGSSIAWAIVLPLTLVGAVALSVGTAVWKQKRIRLACYAAGAGLLLLCGLAIALEHVLHLGTLIGRSGDVVVVIDGSSSMNLKIDGKTNFARAVEETRELVRALKGTSTVSLVVAGPLPVSKTPFPLTDPERLGTILDGLRPTSGKMALHDALSAASLWLSVGANATKQLILITDGQKAGWEIDDRERWSATVRDLRTVRGSEPEVYCRILDMPPSSRNLAVTELTLSRRIVGIDRPVQIRAQVLNAGQTPVAASLAQLFLDGKPLDKRPVPQLEPGAAETLGFSHRFATPGPHVLELRVEIEDAIPDDNRRVLAVHVLDRLPVLIVEGRPSGRLLDNASAVVQLALDPESLAKEPVADPKKPSRLVEVSQQPAWKLGEIRDWDHYHAVIFAGVREIHRDQVARLTDWVTRGGSLMVLPDEHSVVDHYNRWTAVVGDSQQSVLPAKLVKRVANPADKDPVRLLPATLTHPGLEGLRELKKNDLDASRFTAHWLLELPPEQTQTLIGGRLTGDLPWLLERPLGQGKVLLAATSFDLRDSNLPTLQAFLPLVHGLVYHLAEDAVRELDLKPAAKLSLRLPGKLPAESDQQPAAAPAASKAEITTPDESRMEGTCRAERGSMQLDVEGAAMPGLYRATLATRQADGTATPQEPIPFTVASDPAESNLDRLVDADLQSLQEHIKIQALTKPEDLQAIASGRLHGLELWKWLVFLAACVGVLEIVITAWVAGQREAGPAEAFDLASRATSVEFRQQLQEVQSHT
jgi:hypothetical protein